MLTHEGEEDEEFHRMCEEMAESDGERGYVGTEILEVDNNKVLHSVRSDKA